MKRVLLGIDLQYDFCNPKGALYVKGAEEDVKNISKLIEQHQQSLDAIIMSMDSHQPVHIAHQIYWKNSEGKHPDLLSTISKNDVEEGKWIPQYNKGEALDYLTHLEADGAVCTIWPPHCIIGTMGWSIDGEVFSAIERWTLTTGRSYELVNKGMHQSTEHYSIFKAAVEYPKVEATQFNIPLVEKLKTFDQLLIVGEAADFCVANSLRDLLMKAPELATKTYVFTDCMSYIVDGNPVVKKIFDSARQMGVTFCKSTEL